MLEHERSGPKQRLRLILEIADCDGGTPVQFRRAGFARIFDQRVLTARWAREMDSWLFERDMAWDAEVVE